MNSINDIHKTAVIKLMGGLGNQMFQYAAALGVARHQNRELLIDISNFESYKIWPYQLKYLKVPQNIYANSPRGTSVFSSFKDRLMYKLIRSSKLPNNIYREPYFHYDPCVFDLRSREIFLDGYFQSPLYFNDAATEVRECFKMQQPFTETAQALFKKIKNSRQSVALHVRRGDYLSKDASAVHGSLGLDYYYRSIKLIKELISSDVEFFLFSDDQDYMQEVFSDLANSHIVRSDSSAPWEDLFLMASCQHNIIANSSYSWWGAWLNSNENKRVIAPAAWFAREKMNKCNVLDLYPLNWIILK